MTNTRILAMLLAGLVALPACDSDFTVPDLNNPGLEELQSNPTPTAVNDAAQGLLIGARAGMANQAGYVAHLGILGRESLTFDNADPRFIDEMVAGALDPGNGAFGGSGWLPRYSNIRNANIILNALDNPNLSGFSTAQVEAIRGFAKTIQALDYLLIINMRNLNGAPVDVNRGLDDEPGPIVDREAVFAHVVSLLDEAQAHLAAGGNSFPFRLSTGFSGFNTPATFLEFNRALRARVAVYRTDYAAALAALEQSFISTSAPLDLGVYHTFGTGSGDVTNGLFQGADPNIVAEPSIVADAEQKPDGTLDNRVLNKTDPLATPEVDARGVSSDVRFTIYTNLDSPLPIIRNEELILLRAEARWFTGNKEGALADINLIRQQSGGLAPITMPASDAAFITELLKQRRYSLLMEGGHRWIDMRRFNRLSELPTMRPTDEIPESFPIPRGECLARDLPVPCSA